ncbi:hypothetical protein GCK72_020991 [Caenorhabditis remanei]|uniref:DUF19 domain-containing protein n=1 Tax=Caenorhabditis remanei TaxID=31234 RepID=A0A6A5GGY0_CAERE|nr:hypothetical protein GCK72_020991 [Caenorhabditis remanei]KAF1754430.1 hypothetical protein GCK72_020991 [Caenorhabditis remanei]
MRLVFKLFPYFLFLVLVDSYITDLRYPAVCLDKIAKPCESEIKKKKVVLKKMFNSTKYHLISFRSKFPPLSGIFKNYTEQCQNVMKCASGLECFKGRSDRDVFKASCDDVGARIYEFDKDCLVYFLREIYDGRHNCTPGIIVKCMENVCLLSQNYWSNRTTESSDTTQMLFTNLTKVFMHRPRLLGYKCMENARFSKFYSDYVDCVRHGNDGNCLMSVIMKMCRKEILADFVDFEVHMGSEKEMCDTGKND